MEILTDRIELRVDRFLIVFSSRRRHPRLQGDWSSDVCSSDLNTSLRSKYRTAVKKVEKAVLTGDKAKATELFAAAQSVLDTIADKGIFHKNKAARDKSRLSAKVKALAAA